MFLAIGSQVILVLQFSKLQLALIVVFTLVILSLPWWGLTDALWAKPHVPLWLIGIALLAVCVIAVLLGRVSGLIAVLAVSGILYSYLLLGTSGQPRNAARGSFVRIARGIQEIERVRNGRPVQFWFDGTEIFGREFNSLNSTYLWGYTMISATFPVLPKNMTLSPGVLVVVPSGRGDAVEEAIKAYKSERQILNLVSQVPIVAEGGRYSLSFFDVVSDPKNGSGVRGIF
jgi:hypothetical protein